MIKSARWQEKTQDAWQIAYYVFETATARERKEAFRAKRNRAESTAERKRRLANRQRPVNVKEAVVRLREFEKLRLRSEEVAEIDYAPGACRRSYRIVVVRKNHSIEKGARAPAGRTDRHRPKGIMLRLFWG